MNIIKPQIELIDTNIDETLNKIEKAARICYNSKCNRETRDTFIKGLIKSGHESCLEHSSITFKIICSRSCLAQLSRHRFIIPNTFYSRKDDNDRDNSAIDPLITQYLEDIEEKYIKLINLHYKPEDARCILPNATATELYLTVNYRELRHILKLRLDSHAQHEIRYIFSLIYDKLEELYPNNPILYDIKRDII
jgi:thymidylate synthase (FAD)